MNADSLKISYTIWQSAAVRNALATIGEAVATQDSLEESQANVLDDAKVESTLNLLPLGYPCQDQNVAPVCFARGVIGAEFIDNDIFPETTSQWLSVAGNVFLKIVGWTITIFACSLGAPFWFDLLKRVAKLRAGGGNPAEKKPAATAKT